MIAIEIGASEYASIAVTTPQRRTTITLPCPIADTANPDHADTSLGHHCGRD